MKIPLSWLKDFVDIDVDINTLCEKMVAIGLEIEEVKFLGEHVTNVKVCQIEQIEQHPNAERLLCCKVNIGEQIVPIVTNDHHLKVGDKVPVALHGANLANGLHITKGKMRGEESVGMFCGAEELGINADMYPNADSDGVLVLRNDAVVGTDIRDEVGINDYVLDVAVTANRQDCNSVLGLAREVAVALGKTCRQPQTDYTEGEIATTDLVSVEVSAPDICKGYFMQGVTDVTIAKSPVWLTSRLAKVGLHGINNLVDITNYVLYEIGQPMHAFDYADIDDKQIIVRRASEGEKIVPLDGKEYTLCKDDLVIADRDRAVGLAGIMGGANSGIKNGTTCVLFESATFARMNIRRTGHRLGLRSDSSARFEKGIETYTNNLGLSRALHLVEELGCGKVTRGRISIGKVACERTVVFDKRRITKLLGIKIPDERVLAILQSLNICSSIEGNTLKCVVPPYRDDISRDCDVIEELIRVYGYDNIKGTLMEKSRITCGGKDKVDKRIDELKNLLCGLRYNECVFYPFAGKALFDKADVNAVDEKQYIKIINPIGEELSLMNRSLAPNMLQCVALNLSRNNANLRLFEVGKVYLAKHLPLTQLPLEQKRLSVCATNCGFEEFRKDILQAVRSVSDGKLQLVRSECQILHPGIGADVYLNGEKVGYLGKLHPQIAAKFDINVDCMFAELDLDKLFESARKEIVYQPFAKYPSVSRDFAFLCDEDVAAQDVLDVFVDLPLTESAELFDVYRDERLGVGKKSLAVTVVFRDKNKTLQDSDIEKQCSKALHLLKEKYGVVLRAQ